MVKISKYDSERSVDPTLGANFVVGVLFLVIPLGPLINKQLSLYLKLILLQNSGLDGQFTGEPKQRMKVPR